MTGRSFSQPRGATKWKTFLGEGEVADHITKLRSEATQELIDKVGEVVDPMTNQVMESTAKRVKTAKKSIIDTIKPSVIMEVVDSADAKHKVCVATAAHNGAALMIEATAQDVALLLKTPSASQTTRFDSIEGAPNVKYAMSRGGVCCRWYDGGKWRVKSSEVTSVAGAPHWDAVSKMAKTLQTFYDQHHVAEDECAATQGFAGGPDSEDE